MATQGLKIDTKHFDDAHYLTTRKPASWPDVKIGTCQGGSGNLRLHFENGQSWWGQLVKVKAQKLEFYVGSVDYDDRATAKGQHIVKIEYNGKLIYDARTEVASAKVACKSPLKLLLLMQALKGR